MFTNNCLILKNTNSLKNKLAKLGRIEEYNQGNSWNYDCLLCYKDKFIELDTYDVIDLIGLKEDEYIQCITNEELFLAIAALRNDIDSNQYFVLQNGAIEKCECESRVDMWGDFDESIGERYPRKATINELIKYFE